MSFPRCFPDKETFDSYLSGMTEEETSFCQFCTPAYKAIMEARGDCAHPEVVFVEFVEYDAPDPIEDETELLGERSGAG